MNRKEFLLHLIGEVSHFILEGNPSKMVISLHQEEDGLHLCILDNKQRTDQELENITRMLCNQGRPELAGYYGVMAGQNMMGAARLDLVGWQVKNGSAVRTNEGIKIDLWLGGDRFDPNMFSIPDSF